MKLRWATVLMLLVGCSGKMSDAEHDELAPGSEAVIFHRTEKRVPLMHANREDAWLDVDTIVRVVKTYNDPDTPVPFVTVNGPNGLVGDVLRSCLRPLPPK